MDPNETSGEPHDLDVSKLVSQQQDKRRQEQKSRAAGRNNAAGRRRLEGNSEPEHELRGRCNLHGQLSVMSAVHFGSSLSLRAFARIGQGFKASGNAKFINAGVDEWNTQAYDDDGNMVPHSLVNIESQVRLGSSMSLRSFFTLGKSCSAFSFMTLGSSLSIRNFVRLGHRLSIAGLTDSASAGSGGGDAGGMPRRLSRQRLSDLQDGMYGKLDGAVPRQLQAMAGSGGEPLLTAGLFEVDDIGVKVYDSNHGKIIETSANDINFYQTHTYMDQNLANVDREQHLMQIKNTGIKFFAPYAGDGSYDEEVFDYQTQHYDTTDYTNRPKMTLKKGMSFHM